MELNTLECSEARYFLTFNIKVFIKRMQHILMLPKAKLANPYALAAGINIFRGKNENMFRLRVLQVVAVPDETVVGVQIFCGGEPCTIFSISRFCLRSDVIASSLLQKVDVLEYALKIRRHIIDFDIVFWMGCHFVD